MNIRVSVEIAEWPHPAWTARVEDSGSTDR